MGIVKTWFQTSSLLVKVFMAVSITSGITVLHKLYYAPYARRKRYLEAEQWANMVLEKENMKEVMET